MRVMPFSFLMQSGREPGLESPSAIGREAKRSVAGEAVWRGGDGGLWRCQGWETLGSQTPTKTGMVRKADGLPGLGRNGPPCERGRKFERGTTFHANRHCPSNRSRRQRRRCGWNRAGCGWQGRDCGRRCLGKRRESPR